MDGSWRTIRVFGVFECGVQSSWLWSLNLANSFVVWTVMATNFGLEDDQLLCLCSMPFWI